MEVTHRLVAPTGSAAARSPRFTPRCEWWFGEADSRYTTEDGALVRHRRTSFFPKQQIYDLAKSNGVAAVAHSDLR
ncbi:hypothetical protein ABT095_14685 [Kitasatospora sp. NPDC002227]|uniref:hypothetical protein n=1 Tax=Kitasatospora sp. NPDC002227 TaxID=3154773 RepID=UPI0033248D58